MHNVHAARTNLSALLEATEQSEDVIIARAGQPVARLVAYTESPANRVFSSLKGRISISDDSDAPVDSETRGL